MVTFPSWFWPAVSMVFALLWLGTLLLLRRERSRRSPSPSSLMHQRVAAEDMLKTVYALQQTEKVVDGPTLAQALELPPTRAAQEMEALLAFGWIERDASGDVGLTEEGQTRVQELIRAHRLWERYLVDQEGMSLETVHAEAHRREHTTTSEEIERLDAELGHPAWDPHGHAIPAPQRQVPSSPGQPLSEDGEGRGRLRVVCLDDEPASLLAQLMALGIKPGVDIELVDRAPDLLELEVEGEKVPLASAAARHVHVVPAPALPQELGELPSGARARVVEIRGSGQHQRRILDMGFVPGAQVSVIRKAPLGDPVEYVVKGAAVALRRSEANTIVVEELEDG